MTYQAIPRTTHEMQRRAAMVRAKCDLTDAMTGHDLTPMEWLNVLHEMMSMIVVHGLKDEWEEARAKQ